MGMLPGMSPATSARITDGLRYLAREVSASRDEFRRDNQPEGAALLEGLGSHGYIQRGDKPETWDRYALSPAGRRRLAAAEAPDDGDQG